MNPSPDDDIEDVKRQALLLADGIHLLQNSSSLRRRTAKILQDLVGEVNRRAATPSDGVREASAKLGVQIPYDSDARLGYVWLIWGITKERVDLLAIATTEDACGRYLEAGKQMRRYMAVKEEQAFVDHLYGGGLLKAITNARLPLSTTGEKKL